MDKMKKMMIIWGIIIFFIAGILLYIGLTYNKKSQEYHDYEDELVNATEKYVEKYFLYPNDGDEVDITMDMLTGEKLLKETEVNGNKCKGYVTVYKKGMVYHYDPYIDCDVYKTEGFEEK